MTDEATVAEEETTATTETTTATETEETSVDLLPEAEEPEVTVDEQGNRFDKDGNALPPEEETAAERPEWLPEKFKSPEDLAKSYAELEKKLGERNEIPETYELTYGDQQVPLEEDDVEFFKEVGLSNEQAQKVYSQLMDTVVPELQKARTETEVTKLSSAWNMDTGSVQFKERMGKLSAWAKNNMPEEAVSHLRSSAEGVQALWSMMQANLQTGAPPSGGGNARKTQAELQDMVKDPRYGVEEGYTQQVEKEFARVYDGK